MVKRIFFEVVCVLLGILALGLVEVQAETHPTVDYFSGPKYLGARYSPNGKLLAALATSKSGRMNLFVLDLDKHTGKLLTDDPNFDVTEFHWVNDHRLVYSVGNLNEASGFSDQRGGGLFAVNVDGTEPRELYETVAQVEHQIKRYRPAVYLASAQDGSDDVLVMSLERSEKSNDVYRVNTVRGTHKLLTFENPGEVNGWLLDHNEVPRVALSLLTSMERVIYYRDGADAPWRELDRAKPLAPHLYPLGFDSDNKHLIVASNHEGDTAQLYRYDPQTKTFEAKLYGRKDIDVGISVFGEADERALIQDPLDHHLLGVRYNADRPGTEWFDPHWQSVQHAIDGAIPGVYNLLIPGKGDSPILVGSYSDRQGVIWYTFDPAKRRIEELFVTRPAFKAADLVEMKPLTYAARDGIPIPAYLFLPAGVAAKDLPLVVDVHGGPWVRADAWSFSTLGAVEGQFLAAHGYAVLLPNFRGTPGFGRKLFESSYRAWGQSMQDDLEDGVKSLASQGIIDLSRVCIMGGSYGGYAALEGVVKTPDLYRCSVAEFAVSDLIREINTSMSDFSQSEVAISQWKFWVGDPDTNADAMRAVSPAFHADRIKANVLMISGRADVRVPFEQGQVMKDALDRIGHKTDWIIMDGEGHGFGKVENRVQEYDQILHFLDENLKPKVQ